MTTIMASDDLLGLLELSDEDEVIQIIPRKPKTSHKSKKNKTNANSKSKQNKQRNSLSPSSVLKHTNTPPKLRHIKETHPQKIRKHSKKIKENTSQSPKNKQNKKRNSVAKPSNKHNKPIEKLKKENSANKKVKKLSTKMNKKEQSTNARRKSKRIETENESQNNQRNHRENRRKSKRIETENKCNSSKDNRRKSKRIETESKAKTNEMRRKSKRIETESNNKQKLDKQHKEYRRKSKRIETENKINKCNSSKDNRRKSKRIEIEQKDNRRKSKRIEIENNNNKRRVPKRIETESKSYTKTSTKQTKTVYTKENKNNMKEPVKKHKSLKPSHYASKARKSNEFFVDRPRSKSPQPQLMLSTPQPHDHDRPRSKSPAIILSDMETYDTYRQNRSQLQRVRSRSPQRDKHENNMTMELDAHSMYAMYRDIKRMKWTVGSKLEIFSVSQSLWNRGKVMKISRDFQGEYLTVIYHDKQKTLLRNDKHLRPVQIDLTDMKMKEKTLQFISKHCRYKQEKEMREKNQIFYVGQKCEIKDPKYGWSWCEILEIFRDTKGEFVTIEYKIYDVIKNDAQYKRYHIPIGFKALKSTLPRDVTPILYKKWSLLCGTNRDYPAQSTSDHIAARNVELGSMGQFYKKYAISSAEHIPDQILTLIETQNIKLYPILVLDLENTLIPSKLIRSIKKRNDINSSRELFLNFDNWSYDTDYKYLKQLQRIMKQTAETMNTFIQNFRGKICIYSENQYVEWDNLINCLSESAGGDLWRDIYKQTVKFDIINIFACKSVYIEQYGNDMQSQNQNNYNNYCNSDDVIAAKELVLQEYFKSIQMALEYQRLKNESYYVPVIFAIGDDKSDQIAVSQAVHTVFQNFYRLVNFELCKNKQKIGDKTLSDNILRQSLFDTMHHNYIQQFMADNHNQSFVKDTWHGLFSGDIQYMHQLEKI